MSTKEQAHTATGPYAVYPSGDLFVLRDDRTGNLASFPTTKAKAKAEARFMNEHYARIMAEEAKAVRDEIHEMHMASFGARATGAAK